MQNSSSEEIRLEGKLKENISPPYSSRQGIKFYVARLIDEQPEEEKTLFFWDDRRFNEKEVLKIQNLVADDYIVVYAQKRVNPRDGRDIFHVTKFGEEGFEVFD